MEHTNETFDDHSQNKSKSSIASDTMGCNTETIRAEEIPLLKLLQKGLSESTQEDIVFAKEMSKLLSELHLEERSLPRDIKDGLQKVSAILRNERLVDLGETALSVAVISRNVEEKRKEREERKLILRQNSILRKQMSFQKKLDKLQAAVDSLETLVEKDRKEEEDSYSTNALLTTKLSEYQRTVAKLEADINDMGLEELAPEKILNKSTRYMELKEELEELNKSLDEYCGLPPNLLEAKAMLREKRKEYEQLRLMF